MTRAIDLLGQQKHPDIKYVISVEEFYKTLDPITSYFPVVFDNGMRWTHFKGSCQGCDQTIHPSDLRGTVDYQFRSLVVIDGFGFCQSCMLFTPFHYRFHADGGVTGIDSETGEWARWESNMSFFSIVLANIREWFSSGEQSNGCSVWIVRV